MYCFSLHSPALALICCSSSSAIGQTVSDWIYSIHLDFHTHSGTNIQSQSSQEKGLNTSPTLCITGRQTFLQQEKQLTIIAILLSETLLVIEQVFQFPKLFDDAIEFRHTHTSLQGGNHFHQFLFPHFILTFIFSTFFDIYLVHAFRWFHWVRPILF